MHPVGIFKSGNASAVKTLGVPLKVLVREGESVRSAYLRLKQLVERDLGRRSHKRRYGYYEKPSELGRKQRKFVLRQTRARGKLVLHVRPHSALFTRTGPTNALMR